MKDIVLYNVYDHYVKKTVKEFFNLYREKFGNRKPIFVCIGIPEVPGDAIGPVVGSKLRNYGYTVYGTMEKPINSENANNFYKRLWFKNFLNTPIIAIDAAVGPQLFGNIYYSMEEGVQPARGAGKDLNYLGNMSFIVMTGRDVNEILHVDPHLVEAMTSSIARYMHNEILSLGGK